MKEKASNPPPKKADTCALMAVCRYYAGDFLPSATFGAQQGAHGGAGRAKIVALRS